MSTSDVDDVCCGLLELPVASRTYEYLMLCSSSLVARRSLLDLSQQKSPTEKQLRRLLYDVPVGLPGQYCSHQCLSHDAVTIVQTGNVVAFVTNDPSFR